MFCSRSFLILLQLQLISSLETPMVSNADVQALISLGFDALRFQSISANITCGSPPEQYYNTREGYVAPRHRVLSICDANNPLVARPAIYMIDGNDSTTWQSTNNVDKAYIHVALNKPVFGKQLLFKFGDYRRPGQIAIYKSSDFGKTFTPWHFMVSQRQECTTVFGIPDNEIYILPDNKVNRVLCQEYSGYPFEYEEEILIELNGDNRGDGSDVHESQELLKWMNVTNVHIRFSGLYRKFDYIDTRWHHYVVNEVALVARCNCNGHGDGIECPMNQLTKVRRCVCADNTCGDNCIMCCPYYNQYPWKPGKGSAWSSDNTTACEQCNCNKHSEVCIYDANVAYQKQSMDIHGKYSGGGGVCQNCQHNTEGINCENCKEFFYRPLNVDPGSVNACPACGCSLAGSRPTAIGIKYLDCIRDETMAKLFPGKSAGDCFCKQHVSGSKCDICMDGFYRLEATNTYGCRPCECHLPGTVQRLNICHKDFFGQCPCKSNAKLRDCSTCKDGYYDLRNDDADGCKWCDCDVGASISPYICDKVTGVCTCRAHIEGQRCKIVSNGYYFPFLHYIYGQRNLYSAAQSTLVTTIKIPHDAMYHVYISYTMSEDASSVLMLMLKLLGSTEVLFQPNLPQTNAGQCNQNCLKMFAQGLKTSFYFNAGIYSVEISSSYTSNTFLLERIIAIPVDFLTAITLWPKDRAVFLATCDAEKNDLKIGTESESICMAGVYSMTTKFEDGALPCQCSPIGSVNTTCNKFGGQCYCRPGVGGRDCSYCLPGFFHLSSTGCLECKCNGVDKICDPITGQCKCPANTQGRVCNQCECNGNSNECQLDGKCLNCQSNTVGDHCENCRDGYYGNALQGSCSACNCHLLGAYNKSCNIKTGQCYCRPGVVGLTCNNCAPDHFGLSISGCSLCKCNMLGSTTSQCAETGQCLCYSSAEGLKCNQCRLGHYGLPRYACQACNCNTTGTILNTNCMNDEYGQCACKDGVEGRPCDKCKKQYADFGINGCRQCPLCTRQLQGNADNVAESLANVQIDLNLIKNFTSLQLGIQNTQTQVLDAEVQAALFGYRIVQAQNDYTRLQNNRLIPLNNRFNILMERMNSISQQATLLLPVAQSGGAKMLLVYEAALKASQISKDSEEMATNAFTYLVNLNSMASNVVSSAYQYIQTAPTYNFETYEAQIDSDLKLSNFFLGNVTDIGKQIAYQAELSRAYLSSLDKSEFYFQTKERQWEASKSAFLLNIDNVYAKAKVVETLVNQTRDLIKAQKEFIFSTENQQSMVKSLLSKTNMLYFDTLGTYEKIRMHTQTITGGIEVMFLVYNPQNSILRVNVLRGYHLVPRDYPSLKADPYFQLSISPRWFQQGPLESAPITETLDPTWKWPIGGTYTFFITSDQIKITKLIIDVYDKDDDGDDDFMGQVVIDLNAMMPILTQSATQRSYTLTQQSYEDRWLASYNGPGANGLLDLQTMLREQLTLVEDLLQRTNEVHSVAEANANNLQAQAQILSSTFQTAKNYASRAVAAVNTYNEIYRLINSSIEAAFAANRSVQSMINSLNGISVSTFQAKANAELLAAQQFLARTRERNVTYPSFDLYLRSATYGNIGIESPPRSVIEINSVNYHPNINGHTIVVVDYSTGGVEQVRNYRTDIDQTAGARYEQFLATIPTGKVVIIVKQGEGSINAIYQNGVMEQVLELGGRAPFFSSHRGSYILLGYRRQPSETIPWITQVMKAESKGVSELRLTIHLPTTIQALLHQANITFYRALPQWNEIKQLFPQLKTIVNLLIQESGTAAVVQAALQAANVLISQAVTSAASILSLTQGVMNNVDDLTQKFNYLLSASSNVTTTIASGTTYVSQAEGRLQFQQNYLLQAKTLQQTFTTVNNVIILKQSGMEFKFNQLRQLSSQMPFTIQYQQGAQSTYTVYGILNDLQQLYTVIQFDVNVKSLNGILWYFFSRTSSMTGSMGFYLQDGFLYVVYNLGYGDIVGKTNFQLQLGRWYTIHASRVGHITTFVVRDDTGTSFSKQLNSPYSSDPKYFTVSSQSRWFLNGLPNGVMTDLSSRYGNFYGIFDNLFFNGYQYNLWDSYDFTEPVSYANYRYALPQKTSGDVVTFFGNGYIRHNVDSFDVSSQYSYLQIEFRTLKDNVVIFGVTGQSGAFIYGLYIFGGKLMFQFATSLGNNIAIITNNKIYNNGDWYRVKVSRNGVNATLEVESLNSVNSQFTEKKSDYIGVTAIPPGVVLIFGAVSPDSLIPPPVSGVFAGDMRSLSLSDAEIGGEIVTRRFDSEFLIEQKDVSYYGIIEGKIVEGIRFYGYMWWLKQGSYVMMMNYKDITINTIYVSFKTSQLSGLLFYKEGSSTEPYMYIGLIAGNLIVALQQANSQLQPFVTNDLTLSNGQWHNMSIALTNSGFQVQVDNKVLYLGWFGAGVSSTIGKGTIYIGGVPLSFKFGIPVPTERSLEIDFESFLVNRIQLKFFDGTYSGVSFSGIKPGKNEALPPPSCAASFPDLMYAPDPLQVRFGKVPWASIHSYIGYDLSQATMEKYFMTSFVITMSFRAVGGNGIVFYIADSLSDPKQYVSLEMVNGNLRYEFSNGEEKVTIETGNTTTYSEEGKWYKVYLLRIYQFGAILVPETMEYKNARHDKAAKPIQLKTALFIGGLPNHVNAPHFINRNMGYNGCLRKFEISSGFETYAMDFSKPNIGGTATGTAACYSNTEPGVYFNGKDSWVNYANNFVLSENFELELRFRTFQRSGVMLYLYGTDTSNGIGSLNSFGKYILVEMDDGKITFHYKAGNLMSGQVFEWKDPEVKTSYYLCDQTWHTVKITKLDRIVRIKVDNINAFGGGTLTESNSGGISGYMYVGGVKSSTQKPGVSAKNFHGCLELVSLGDRTERIMASVGGNNVVFGCPTF